MEINYDFYFKVNTPELNQIMLDLALYEGSLPGHPEYKRNRDAIKRKENNND